jgi:ABC-2 type transport system permease protein
MFPILRKEINSFLSSLVAYIIMALFLTGMGLFIWIFPDYNVLDYGYADLSTLFSMAPYIFMFLIPAVTMRSFAEEKKGGTLELLLTRPLTDWDIILGKYLACFLLILFTLLPTLIYYVSVYLLGNPEGNIDSAGVFGSYVGLLLLAAVFTAIGIFASSISENQIVSFIVAAFLCFLWFTGFSALASLSATGTWTYLMGQLGLEYHYNALSKGLIDSRNVIYFLSVIALALMATRLVLESRKW